MLGLVSQPDTHLADFQSSRAAYRVRECLEQCTPPTVPRDRGYNRDCISRSKASNETIDPLAESGMDQTVEYAEAERAGRQPSLPGISRYTIQPTGKEHAIERLQEAPHGYGRRYTYDI